MLALAALLVSACGGPRISKQNAAAVIQAAPEFKVGKLLYVPRVVAIPAEGIGTSTATREGEAMNIIQIAGIDPVVAVLRARDQVTIEDFVSAVPSSIVIPAKPDSAKPDSVKKSPVDSTHPADSTKTGSDTTKPKPKPPPLTLNEPQTSPPPTKPFAQSWVHTLRVTPRPQLFTSELAPDDGEENPEAPRVAYGAQPVGRTPGWTLLVGNREFMRILDVGAYSPSHGDPKGDALVDFLWRWRSTKPGTLFDTESAEFQSLPAEVQQAALTGSVALETSTMHWARATLFRDGGAWKVTSVNWGYGDDKPHDKW